MDGPTSAAPVAAPSTSPPRTTANGVALNLPNLLTYARIAAVPALVGCLLVLDGPQAHTAAFLVFAVASITDWLDGYLARVWSQQSALGRMLDPIADKLLVGATLLMLVHLRTIDGVAIIAAVIILCREILVSGLREFLAELDVKVHVSRLAKWKTAVQMVALGALLLAPAVQQPTVLAIGVALLWLAAGLTLWTGTGYLIAAVRRATDGSTRED